MELAPSGQKSINEIEGDLGITPGLLHKWKAGMQVKGAQAFPGKGRRPDEEERIRQRKREVELLRTARDILKAGLAIFSSSTERPTNL